MNIIKEHIRKGSFCPVYLLYGTEEYLKRLYRDKLKHGILGSGDAMNLSVYQGHGIDPVQVRHMAETMPFFAERRLVLIEDSGWFKSQNDFADTLKELPDTTCIVFVETEVDKRNRLYKAVKELGYISEMNGMDERNLRLFALSLFQKEGRKLKEDTLSVFLETVGTDMEQICNEAEKVICYTMGREEVIGEDIFAVCSEQLNNRIFVMIDAIAQKNSKRVMELYHELLILREKPLSIHYLILRHFHILLQVKEMAALGKDSRTISSSAKIPPFAVSKYLAQAKNLTRDQMKKALEIGIEVEEQVKNGKLNEQIGLEFMVANCINL